MDESLEEQIGAVVKTTMIYLNICVAKQQCDRRLAGRQSIVAGFYHPQGTSLTPPSSRQAPTAQKNMRGGNMQGH